MDSVLRDVQLRRAGARFRFAIREAPNLFV
jgi:hypothetical protein